MINQHFTFYREDGMIQEHHTQYVFEIHTIIKKLVLGDVVVVGFSALMSAVMFLGGMILFMLGMLGEYIGRMYITMNNAPQYVIKDVVGKGFEEEKGKE